MSVWAATPGLSHVLEIVVSSVRMGLTSARQSVRDKSRASQPIKFRSVENSLPDVTADNVLTCVERENRMRHELQRHLIASDLRLPRPYLLEFVTGLVSCAANGRIPHSDLFVAGHGSHRLSHCAANHCPGHLDSFAAEAQSNDLQIGSSAITGRRGRRRATIYLRQAAP